jgi:hypothetical protein
MCLIMDQTQTTKNVFESKPCNGKGKKRGVSRERFVRAENEDMKTKGNCIRKLVFVAKGGHGS